MTLGVTLDDLIFDFSVYPRAIQGGKVLQAVIKRELTDFVVDEIPDWQADPAGTHLYVQVEKSDLTTQELIKQFAEHFGLMQEQIGHAGLKDRRAVTTQWLSLAGVSQAAVEAWEGSERFRCLSFAQGATRIKEGQLLGNRFKILLRAPDDRGFDAGDAAAIEAALMTLQQLGIPNYYGPQRFGRDRDNARRGLYLLRQGKGRSKRWLDRLCINSLQSLIFNDWVAARLQAGTLNQVMRGDIAHKHATFGKFLVDDAARENPRAVSFEISATGPMLGRKYHEAQFDARDIEDGVLATRGLTRDDFKPCLGSRREGRVLLNHVAVELAETGIWLRFALPRGAYATSVLREFVAVDCLSGCE
jgi:tRNA pseudouridine13 synthase